MTARNDPPSGGIRSAAASLSALPPDMERMEALQGFQRRSWVLERIAWLGMLGLLLVGLAGGFGGAGWLAGAEATTPDGALRITYSRVQRQQSPTMFRVEALRPDQQGRLELRLGRDLLDGWEVQSLLPQAAESRGDAQGLVLTYRLQGGGAAPVLLLMAQAVAPGIVQASIGTAEGAPVVLRILVWP